MLGSKVGVGNNAGEVDDDGRRRRWKMDKRGRRSGRAAGDMGTRVELTVPGGWRSDDEIR